MVQQNICKGANKISKLIILGINLGQFYALYSFKQFLATQSNYKVANFWTESYFQNKLPDEPYYNLKDYIEADWSTGREIIKNLPCEFTEIVLYFAPVTKGLNAHTISKYREGTFKNNEKGKTFVSVYREYKKILLAIDSGLPAIHVINDPLEPDLSQFSIKELFYYEIPGRAKKSDYLDKMIALQSGAKKKIRDFTFGFSNIARDQGRSIYYKEFKESGLPFYYKGPEEDNYIDTDEYNDLIAESRYTYIIPAYDKNHFSYIRYKEALHRGCIPLIHPDCNLEWFSGAELREMKSRVCSIEDLRRRI